MGFTSNFFVDVKFHSEKREMNNKTKQNRPDCCDTAPLNFLCLSLATSPFHLKAAAKLAKIESMTVNVIFLAQNSVPL